MNDVTRTWDSLDSHGHGCPIQARPTSCRSRSPAQRSTDRRRRWKHPGRVIRRRQYRPTDRHSPSLSPTSWRYAPVWHVERRRWWWGLRRVHRKPFRRRATYHQRHALSCVAGSTIHRDHHVPSSRHSGLERPNGFAHRECHQREQAGLFRGGALVVGVTTSRRGVGADEWRRRWQWPRGWKWWRRWRWRWRWRWRY